MTFIIPMAGHGSRFKEAGFNLPKMLIEAHGKTLLEWSVDSLPLDICTHLIFIGLKEHAQRFDLENKIRNLYETQNLSFLWLDNVTRGQAETVYCAKEIVNQDKPLLVFNIDTMFSSSSLKKALLDNHNEGILGAFISVEPRFSYAHIGDDGYVDITAEKEVISNNALDGLYHFSKAKDFFDIAKIHIENDIRSGGEFYIAPMYNDLIKNGNKFRICLSDQLWILGTPDELVFFSNNYVKNEL